MQKPAVNHRRGGRKGRPDSRRSVPFQVVCFTVGAIRESPLRPAVPINHLNREATTPDKELVAYRNLMYSDV